MPVLSCPKCPTKLKVPDGAKGNVKCPKCATVFPATGTGSSGGFEVVSETPARTAPKPAAPPTSSAKAKDDEGDDFEVVDEKPAKKSSRRDDDDDDRPRSKKRRDDDDDDDDDDDRPRKKRRDDDDDDDDRPRSKRKRRDDDDDDDYDDRPRKRRRRRDDDEDEWLPKKKANAFGPAKTGALLLGISFWLYLGSLGLMTFFVLLNWGGTNITDVIFLPGLVGLANWIVAGVGLGFCIAGPKQARGLAIAGLSVASVHLILMLISANDGKTATMGFGRMTATRSTSMDWGSVVTMLMQLDTFLARLVYQGKYFGDFILPFLGGACELARFIIIMLLLSKLGSSARDEYTAENARKGMMIGVIVTSALVLVFLLFMVIMQEMKLTSLSTIINLSFAIVTVIYLAHTLTMIVPAMAAMSAKDALSRRSRSS